MRSPLTGRLPPSLVSGLESSRRMDVRVCEVPREGAQIQQHASNILFVRS